MQDYRNKLATLAAAVPNLIFVEQLTRRVVCIIDYLESKGLTEGPFTERLGAAFGLSPEKALELEHLLVRVASGGKAPPAGNPPAADPFAALTTEAVKQ